MLITASCRDEPGDALTTDLPEGMTYFPRESPRVGETVFNDAGLHGRLELRDGCLRGNVDHRDGGPVILWPAGFVPHLGEDGVIEVHDGLGRTVVRVGNRLEMAGGSSQDSLGPCQGPHWRGTRIESVIRGGHESQDPSETPTMLIRNAESDLSPMDLEEPAPESTRIISQGTHEFVTEDLLEAHRIEPYLVGNLLFIAHWDDDVQSWYVHDVAGYFTPDQLTPPPGVAIPPNPEIGILNELERGKLYDFHVRSDQIVNIVEGEMGDRYLNSGANFFEWRR